jgi:hypothetical protein
MPEEFVKRFGELFKRAEEEAAGGRKRKAYSDLRKELLSIERSVYDDETATPENVTLEEEEYKCAVNAANRAAAYCRRHGTDEQALKELHEAVEKYLSFAPKIEESLGKEEFKRIHLKYPLHVRI